MARRTSLVSNRVRNGQEVVASARTHRDAIAEALAERVSGWSAPQAATTIRALADHLEMHNRTLEEREDVYVAEQADDPMLREQRDEALSTLKSLVTRARSRIADALGATGLQRYGLDGSLPRSPSDVASHVASAINLLRRDVTEIDDGLGGRLTTTKLADRLSAALTPLIDTLSRLRVEAREHEGALTARDRALADWTDAYQGVASSLSGLYQLAGRRDLAERIRPTERRASGRETSEPTAEPVVVEPVVSDPPVEPEPEGPVEPELVEP